MQAYKKAEMQKENLTEREIDAYALTQSALKILECQKNWDMPEIERVKHLFEALKINSLLWRIFQEQISAPGNPLPRKLREDLLTLGFFVDKRTRELSLNPEPEKLTILININLNLAAGLRASVAKESSSQSQTGSK